MTLSDPFAPVIKKVIDHFPMQVGQHYQTLIQTSGAPIAKQVIPDAKELEDLHTTQDPLNEEGQAPVSQIIHRYPHRIIFLVTNQCATYCRFCMRKRRLNRHTPVTREAIHQGLDYIRRTSDINEVILSGGDPFMLDDTSLKNILMAIKRISHIRTLRIHTRIPNVWPQRISAKMAAALSEFHPLYINIHFNHPDEITPEAREACGLLADAGIPLGSQTVLLRGVNDNATTLHRLFENLLEIRVKPYYLHQLDHVQGTAHFRVPLKTALALIKTLRGTVSGLAIPRFMVDLPGGGGKVELLAQAYTAKNGNQWIFQNFEGRQFTYPLK